jgi:hypothetical protein
MMHIGKALIALGFLLIVAGVVFLFADRLPLKLGRLPGDIAIEKKDGGGFYFPVVTCLLVSAVLTLLMWLFQRR